VGCLTRAAGTLASVFHAKATTATIRAQLIAVPARLAECDQTSGATDLDYTQLARTARNLILHLPTDWPWAAAWTGLFTAAVGPPPATT
jgi:hypothetical protein